MKIALLVCDRIGEDLREVYGTYSQMFGDLLPALDLRAYYVCEGHFPADINKYEAYICSGSRFSVYDEIEWVIQLKSFVRAIHLSGKKFVGSCFGHQLLAEALGGKVQKSENGWCVGVHEFEILSRNSWMEPYKNKLNMLMMCQDQVVELPEGTTLIASGSDCQIGMFMVGKQMLGIQAHPEFGKDYNKILMERRKSKIGVQKAEIGIQSLEKELHGLIIRQWITNFLLF